jgi:hypothetical protein
MVGGGSEKDKLDGCGLSRARYLRRDIAELPYDITVPRLTRKERTYLDSLMPLQPNLRRNQLGFNISELRAYEEVYRFFPTYVEALF